MLKIFKTGAKDLFLTIFAAAIIAVGFFAAQVPKAEASTCAVECVLDGGTCYYDDNTYDFSTAFKGCVINTLTAKDTDVGGTTCTSGSGSSEKLCLQNKCPNTSSVSLNGKPCSILKPNSAAGWCTSDPSIEVTGYWDASDPSGSRCIMCSSGKETQVYGTTSSIATGSGDGNFDSACPGVDSECDEKAKGCVGTAGFCNSIGAYTSCPSNNCSGGACPVASALSVSANPSTITKDTPSSVVFTVTNASGNVLGAAVAISGADISANCSSTTGSDGKCTASVTATSVGTATATASKTGSTNGTTTITVQAAPACPKGSGSGSSTSFAVDFKNSTFTLEETFKISYLIPPESEDGAICFYAPGSSTPAYSINKNSSILPDKSSNFDTSFKPTSAGTWKVVINKGYSCSSAGTCYANTNVAGATASPLSDDSETGCTSGTCDNIVNPPKYCSDGSWTTCAATQTCFDGTDSGTGCVDPVPPPPACTLSCTDGKVPDSTCTDCVAPPCSGSGMFESPLGEGYCSIGEILTKSTSWILSLVSSIIVLVIIIGGLMYISSAGDEERLRASKNIIYYAIIGLGIILISAALINEVTTVLKG